MAFQQSDITALFTLLQGVEFPNVGAATLGTQTLNCTFPELCRLFLGHGRVPRPMLPDQRLALFDAYERHSPDRLDGNILLRMLGFSDIVNIDVIANTPTAVVHNLSEPIPDSLRGRFSLLLDASTGHHVFDRVRLFENIKDMLVKGGVVVHVTLMDPFCQAEGFLSLQTLVRFYECNGFGNMRAFLSSTYGRNSIYELHGDLRGYRVFADKERYSLVFMAQKIAETPTETGFLTWHYELQRRLASQPGVDPARLTGRKVAVWGTTGHYRDHYQALVQEKAGGFAMRAFVDSDSGRRGQTLDGYEIVGPEDLAGLDVDVVLLASHRKNELFDLLCERMYGRPEVLAATYDLYRDTFLAYDNARIFDDYWLQVHGRHSDLGGHRR